MQDQDKTKQQLVDEIALLQQELASYKTQKQTLEEIYFQAHLLNCIEQAVIATDVHGTITYWNQFAETLYGWSACEAVGRHLVEITPTETSRPQAATIMSCLQRGESSSGEILVKRKDGTSFVALVTRSPIYNDKGDFVGIVRISSDMTQPKQATELGERKHAKSARQLHLGIANFEEITEHKCAERNPSGESITLCHCQQAEAALRQSEARYHTIRELTSDFIYSCAVMPEGAFINEWATRYLSQITGYTIEELPEGDGWLAVVYLDDLPAVRQFIHDLLVNRQPRSLEYRIITKQGEIRWIRDRIQPIWDKAVGRIVEFLGAVEDITKRKRAEEDLRRYERIVSAAPDGIALLDCKAIYQVVNQTYLDWNLKRYDDIVGHSVSELLGEEAFNTVVKPLLERCLAGEIIRHETWFNYADGHQRFVGITYAPYVETNGTISGVVVTSRDLTQLKRAEAALRQTQETAQRQLAEIETIYATTPIGLCFVDLNLRYVRLNERLAEINGLPVANHIGRTVREVLPELADELESTYQQVIKSGLPILDLEVHGTTPAQPDLERDWLTSYYPLIDSDGRILGVNVMVQDITERKQLERALQASEAKLSDILNSAIASIHSTRVYAEQDRLRYEHHYTSAGCEVVFGYTPAEFQADPSVRWSRVLSEDLERVLPLINEAICAERTITFEYRFYHCKNNSLRWISVNLTSRWNQAADCWIVTSIETDITNRKQAEAALRQSEERFRSIFENAGIGILLTSEEHHKLEQTNPFFQKLLGYSAEELANLDYTDITHPEDLTSQQVLVQECYAGMRDGYQLEKRYIRKDGEIIWIKLTVSLVRDTAGHLQFAVSLVEDITARKQAEQQIKFQANLLNQVCNAVICTDQEGRIIYWNRFAKTLYQWAADEVMGRTILEVLTPPGQQQLLAEKFAYLQQKHQAKGEILLQRKDGSVIPVWISTVAIRDDRGEVIGFVGVSFDISERKQAEQKIREQAALLDITSDAIAVRDLQHQILFWNQGAERLYGWTATEALGKNANQLLYKDASPPLEVVEQALVEKGEWQGEFHQLTKDGKEIIVASRWTRIYNSQGLPTSILIVNTDITEKKQLEAQFLRAQRMESIGNLASGIAHDLNNLLAPILLSAQLLLMKISDERTQQLLKIVETNAKRGADVVKQVLSFARGVEGDRTVVQVNQLIAEIQQVVIETFPKSIELDTDIAPGLWPVSGDGTQLHQVLMNLCVNARDAMPNGGTLSLLAENLIVDDHYVWMNPEAQVGSYVVLTVTDTGTGIPPEIINKVFKPFFTTKEPGQGTGLGLATVLGIIKNHGGFVQLSSQVGRGTQFQVYLPAVQIGELRPVEELEPPSGNGELVLVIDDEAAICEITKTSLETYGYQVLTASDGIEAVALYALHKNKIRLVVTDIMMPSMDGITAIRTLQKINPQVKIIAISGLPANEQVAELTHTGVKAFLLKPYTAKDLLHTLHQILTQESTL
ncbi:hypothetical protein BZZ01_11195 [Nostocales cyanobacterium HT-58-2]|nr:hypothetical protein BZZ01_11195 [Nostocales cyanobacterium HT-58-2]